MKPTEVFESVYLGIKDRLVSPLYGTLIISWCIWNWRIFYVSFFVSEDKLPNNRLTVIEQYFCNNLWHLIIGPLLTAAIILLVIPFLSNQVFRLSLWYDRKKDFIRNKHNKKRLYTWEEFNKYFQNSEEFEDKYNSLRIEYNKYKDEAEKEIDDQKLKVLELKERTSKFKHESIDKTEIIRDSYSLYKKTNEDFKYFMNNTVFSPSSNEFVVESRKEDYMDAIVELLNHGIIKLVNKRWKKYEVTDIGMMMKEYFYLDK